MGFESHPTPEPAPALVHDMPMGAFTGSDASRFSSVGLAADAKPSTSGALGYDI